MIAELLHRGSVKDIYRLSPSELAFQFSNRYSIFDWGEMPDAIPGKGHSLALMGCKFMSHLSALGFQTHYLNSGTGPGLMVVKSVDVPRDDISVYQKKPTNILIPLEVIFRFGAPKGSSLLRRFKSAADWLAAGFDRTYQEGEMFHEVKIDFTTKLERLDRVLTDVEAKQISGMSDEEWFDLRLETLKIATEIKNVFAKFGAVLWDGKFEFAFDENRKIMLVDSIGLDEMRLTLEGWPLSKELLRQHYLGTSWFMALTRAKETHPAEFKEFCINALKEEPKRLPSAVLSAVANLYETVAELILCDAKDMPRLRERLIESLTFLVRKT